MPSAAASTLRARPLASYSERVRLATPRRRAASCLYHVERGQPAAKLADLVPQYLAELPIDPYSGEPFRYRVSVGEQIEGLGAVLPGQGVVWSTGPDRTDHGGHSHGGRVPDDEPQWSLLHLDLIVRVPYRP